MDLGLIDSFGIRYKSAFRNLKSTILLCAMLFALSMSAEAQEPKKVWRIGHLSVADPATDSWSREFGRLCASVAT